MNCNGGIISDLRLVYDPENGEIQYKYTCNDYGNLFCFVTETVVQIRGGINPVQSVTYLNDVYDLNCGPNRAMSQAYLKLRESA